MLPPVSGSPARPLAQGSFGRTFAALRERDFAWFFVGNLAFFLAMQMNFLLQGFLAYELTGTAIALGLLGISVALPMLLVAPLGGVIADRENKRTLLVLAQLFVTGVNLVLAILILTDLIRFWQLLVVTIGVGLTFSIVMPARQAIVPMLVPQHRMTNAIALQMGSMNVTRIIGPAMAGLLIAPLGVGVVWVLSVALFFLSVLTLLPLPRHGMRSNRPASRFRDDLSGGFRYIARQPLIRLLLLTAMVMPLFGFPVQLVLPVFAEDVFHRGPSALGWLMAAAGVGGLVGTLVVANIGDAVRRKAVIMLAGSGLMGLSFITFALAPSFGIALVAFGIGNIGGMVFQITNNATVQAVVDDEMRGRVMSVLMMSFGLMPLGLLPLTIAIDAFGAPAAVAGSAALMLVLLVFMFTFIGPLRTLSVDQLAFAELSPAQAARLVAEGKLTAEQAARLTGRAPGAATATNPTTNSPHTEAPSAQGRNTNGPTPGSAPERGTAARRE